MPDIMNQEDAYQAYNCVRKEFPDYANFEGCPWVETVNRTWVRSNAGYLLEVTPTQVKLTGPTYAKIWWKSPIDFPVKGLIEVPNA